VKADPQEKMSCRASSCFLIADINLSKHSNKVSLLQFLIEKQQRPLVSFLRSLNPHSGIDSLLDNKLDIPKCVQVASLSCGTSPTASPAKGCPLSDSLSSDKPPEIDILLLGKSILLR